jgi:starvation-inducible outer membrane lipoprotein
MKKRWLVVLAVLMLMLTACPQEPNNLGAQWDSSNFEQAIWQ